MCSNSYSKYRFTYAHIHMNIRCVDKCALSRICIFVRILLHALLHMTNMHIRDKAHLSIYICIYIYM